MQIRQHSVDTEIQLDDKDWRILTTLQSAGRSSFAELGRQVALSAPSAAERVRRLEEFGVISSYRAMVDRKALGLPISTIIRLHVTGKSYRKVVTSVAEIPEVVECFHVTGPDCLILKVVLASMAHLEQVLDKLMVYGEPTTSVVLSSPVSWRVLGQELPRNAPR